MATELTKQDKDDRVALKRLFEKRQANETTKAGFFYFENQSLMIAEGKETYVVVSHDMAIAFPLFVHGDQDFWKFEKAMRLLGASRTQPIATLWDIGANIGSICIPAVRGLVQKAIAFEPESQLFKLLRANAILNEVDGSIECHNTALGRDSGSCELMLGANNTGDYRIKGKSFPDDSWGETERRPQTVNIRPLDDFIDTFDDGRTLLWIDVQGFEGHVIAGASKILAKRPPIVSEFWPYGLKRADSFPAFRDALCTAAYRSYADLSDPEPIFQPLTAQRLEDIYQAVGEAGADTDLIFI